ncbi:uncharacterized protein LOC129313662 isoform X3 [Prosopis cineraria]|uniref:uncharacterized protein LOC129313662 isoform X3 n=1 Tax=Prosopis cineraria TaxID=364024 RepID=UPI00240EC384|nr:uncharacterized protein LOC129313662 isoform X3 [Prosopis cineraria]
MLPEQWVPPCGNRCTHKYAALTKLPCNHHPLPILSISRRVFCKKGCNSDEETWEECLEDCNHICYKDPVIKDQQWSAYIDRSPGSASCSEDVNVLRGALLKTMVYPFPSCAGMLPCLCIWLWFQV